MVGAAVSPGIARGPIKVMNDPFVKGIDPDDILVAVTTDPGWTLLFNPAAAVILEIAGGLQPWGVGCVSMANLVSAASRTSLHGLRMTRSWKLMVMPGLFVLSMRFKRNTDT